MHDSCVIGGGFSAAVTSRLLSDNNVAHRIITPIDSSFIGSQGYNYNVNKFFGSRSKFKSILNVENKAIKFHTRIVLGGNSTIWGGFIDSSRFHQDDYNFFDSLAVKLLPLSFLETGSISNKLEIKQLIDQRNGGIKFFQPVGDLVNGFVNQIKYINSKVNIGWVHSDIGNNINSEFDKVYLCVGLLNLLEILYSSQLIHSSDVFSLDEYDHRFLIRLSDVPSGGADGCVIVYNLLRAFGHLSGFQKNFSSKNFIPIYIHQIFSNTLRRVEFSIIKGAIKSNYEGCMFGDSIHYCNLRINGVKISDFLKEKFNGQLLVLGMPSTVQHSPGPISNDIYFDCKEVISNELK